MVRSFVREKHRIDRRTTIFATSSMLKPAWDRRVGPSSSAQLHGILDGGLSAEAQSDRAEFSRSRLGLVLSEPMLPRSAGAWKQWSGTSVGRAKGEHSSQHSWKPPKPHGRTRGATAAHGTREEQGEVDRPVSVPRCQDAANSVTKNSTGP
ncbi:hypothetical protein BD779DRAFT_501541 [Infundibulicybe gibba]|nr:hypothetical protein BD779DRAFT_501541 [Infundibulicybe gibba]